jgi:hypothetical protein
MDSNQKLELLAAKEVLYNEELYIIVDFLNKNLKDRDIIFGLALEGKDKAVISIYNA